MEKKDINTIGYAVSCVEKQLNKNLFQFKNEIHATVLFKSALEFFMASLSSKLLSDLAHRVNSIHQTDIVSSKEEDLDNPDIIVFHGIDFSNRTLENYCFDDKILINVSFRNCKLINCRFRNTCIYFCDLRYSDINGGTFEKAYMWWSDLYRAYFQGVIRFANATISDTSINNAYFSGATLIRKMNFKNKSLLQMDADIYKYFLIIWDSVRNYKDKIKTDDNITGEEKINRITDRRNEELELIFKNLSSIFIATGFSNDSNWAYVQGKKAERKVLGKEISIRKLLGKDSIRQLKVLGKWSTNWLFDIAFGYGESLVKISRTYLTIVTVFTFIYMYECNIQDIVQAFIISFKNMVGSSDDLPLEDNIFLSVLNVIQTTAGILITGIFGFILGNKIRNQ